MTNSERDSGRYVFLTREFTDYMLNGQSDDDFDTEAIIEQVAAAHNSRGGLTEEDFDAILLANKRTDA
jgi:hypothetical protein